jgi:Protein of unknown function (DUF1761)
MESQYWNKLLRVSNRWANGIRLTATPLCGQSRSHFKYFHSLSLETPVRLSMHHLHHMNHWAVLVSALILWLLGAAWYSPALFAKPWMAALGIVPDGPKKGLALGMISSLIGDLLVAFVMLHLIVWSEAGSFGAGAFVGFLCWLGFFAATQFPQGIYESRPGKLFAINAGYWLVGLLIVGGLLASWR